MAESLRLMLRKPTRFGALAAAAVGAVPAAAQPAPDYDLDWCTVGAPGNRPATEADSSLLQGRSIGAVNYEYRLTRTEVTVSQWLEFVEAYSPYHGGFRGADFTSDHIFASTQDPDQQPEYIIVPGRENVPANMSWHMAARYCNWLHNGKVNAQWAFESGAYDTSTFGIGPDGATDQLTRSPGARFWIPSLDEWTKGAFYDPDRNGPGQGGYWLYPDQSDDPLIPGFPENGGTTNAGIPGFDYLPAGMYPEVQSPWGLLDASGGNSEWTETSDDEFQRARYHVGSSSLGDDYFLLFDLLGYSIAGLGSGNGLRVASVVPAPGAFAFWATASVCLFAKRRSR